MVSKQLKSIQFDMRYRPIEELHSRARKKYGRTKHLLHAFLVSP